MLLTENSGIRCIKFSLIFFSVVLFITGISLIIVGSTINEIFLEFSTFLSSLYCYPSTFVITIGFIIFGVAAIGCYGAIKESVSIITAFGILLGLTALMQASSATINNSLMYEIELETLQNMNSTMLKYSKNIEAQNAIDFLQEELHCCGISGPEDWMAPMYNNGSAPKSCCISHSSESECDTTFNIGCYIVLNAILLDSSRILTVSAYLLAFTQIFGMLFAFYLSRMLREQKIARDYRRWAIRNQLLSNMTYDPFFNSSNAFFENQEKSKEPIE